MANENNPEEEEDDKYDDKVDETYVDSDKYHDNYNSIELGSFIFKFMRVMKKRSKQICFFLAISITALAALHNGILRTRKARDPEKFFDETSMVNDYQFGDLKDLSKRASENEVSFVMYYAPWDAECIRAKKEFEIIAKHFSHQIFIGAINCWWSYGECKKYYNFKRFPVLVAHVRMAGEVEYKGPLIASYITPFLDNLLDPIVPIRNEGDLLDLRSKHDAVLVGYYDFNESPQPPGYRLFFSTAVKALSNDPWRSVAYSVISNKKVALKLKIMTSSTLTLYLLNSTEHYGSKSFKIGAILSWVYSRVKQNPLIKWITPTGIKSRTLSDVLTNKPTFILFTPRSFIMGVSPYFDLLREVVMDYFNCDKSPTTKSIIHRSILRRHLIEEKLVELEEKCHEMQTSNQSLVSAAVAWNSAAIMEGDTCCHSDIIYWQLPGKTVDKKCFCTACVHVSTTKCPANCKRFNCLATASRYLDTFDPFSANKTAFYCNEIKSSYQPKYTPYYKIIVSCSGIQPNVNEFDDSHYALYRSDLQKHDEKVEKMVKELEAQHCQRLSLGLTYSDLNFPESSEGHHQQWRTNFTGLSCKTNKTLSFVAIDSVLFPEFAENLGLDLLNAVHSTIGVIVDSVNENIFVLDSKLTNLSAISKRHFVEFIKNFTSSSLERFLRSQTSTTGHCINENNTQVICVPEITGETFAQIVLDNSKDVVLMYYAPWCGFCTSVAHIYLSVARFFMDVKGISFARINGDTNDLPWEYTVDRYPTILFFPAKRKAESLSFPTNVPITTTSLIQFILANAQSDVKWQTSFQLCNRNCLIRNLVNYSSQTRKLIRQWNNHLNSLSLVYNKLESVLENINLKRRKTQLNQLNLYKKYLLNEIIIIRKKLIDSRRLRDIILLKLRNYDESKFSYDVYQTIHENEKKNVSENKMKVDETIKKKNETIKKKSPTSTKYSANKKQNKIKSKDEL